MTPCYNAIPQHVVYGSSERPRHRSERHSRVFLPKLLGHLSLSRRSDRDSITTDNSGSMANRHAFRPAFSKSTPVIICEHRSQNLQSRWGEFG